MFLTFCETLWCSTELEIECIRYFSCSCTEGCIKDFLFSRCEDELAEVCESFTFCEKHYFFLHFLCLEEGLEGTQEGVEIHTKEYSEK